MSQKPVNQLVDHFFRNEFGKAVTLLTSKFGIQYLEIAEDAVQEALGKAMQNWGFGKIPDNPSGWIIRVAQNKIIDYLRRQQKVFYATQVPDQAYHEQITSDEQFNDEMIKMIFACCNPKLSADYQIILTLKILGGLSIREIASALLKKEETIAKSYTRAKKQFQKENLQLELPEDEAINDRLLMVLKTIYLLFNEGYKSTEGEQLIRRDLCEEAMRLNQLLLENASTNNEWSRSLMALMHFQVARFDSRVDEYGLAISLTDQDRSKWDQRHITFGNRYLTTIENGIKNTYFIQAAISGIHCAAKTWEDTNWTYILMLYNHLYALRPNPVVALNRIYPFAMVHGAEAALTELNKLKTESSLLSNHLLAATEAELHQQLGDLQEAIKLTEKAIDLAKNEKDKIFLSHKCEQLKKAMIL
ncbi:RNA polymerase sigma factor [Marinoscillum pacificum]|uniref:RNA polymerase sigma factor n=1 Tax=Marinoscillum pacificum TaxID=392723 RepID=UPI002157F397|nr:sigma-70 family RNA polymerase sigma factor [Marinoscillum pacificum]